ncbi:MAG: aminotransferase class I/II-fold pyridoxal phosphate-dependent enzyme [Zetaproteobacteria bacterium]|nr:aminotransferase class I/II-fold pyridoxal phosphate-dependent enzyme [Zetaproteobacteria bacterium]
MTKDMGFATVCVHAGMQAEEVTGAVIPPIFQTSTYMQQEPGVHAGYDYSRADNPTREHYETALAAAEGAEYALSFASGLCAVQALVHQLEPGSHVLVCDDVYGGTGRLFRELYQKYGIEFQFVDMSSVEQVAKWMRPNTRMVWVETPTNPTLKVVDIAGIAELTAVGSALLVVDNTFATPCFQRPLSCGADIVLHSTTKYIGGHSDLIGGAVVMSDANLFERLKFYQFAAGGVPSPFECFLLLRSLKTLDVRMQRHAENAEQVVQFLARRPEVDQIFFPGSVNESQHEVMKRQMSGTSGMISFNLKGDYAKVKKFLQSLEVFTLAESLGGVESLVNHPAKMTHASVPPALREKLGITSQMVRLSVGIESSVDILADLEQAFDRLGT